MRSELNNMSAYASEKLGLWLFWQTYKVTSSRVAIKFEYRVSSLKNRVSILKSRVSSLKSLNLTLALLITKTFIPLDRDVVSVSTSRSRDLFLKCLGLVSSRLVNFVGTSRLGYKVKCLGLWHEGLVYSEHYAQAQAGTVTQSIEPRQSKSNPCPSKKLQLFSFMLIIQQITTYN